MEVRSEGQALPVDPQPDVWRFLPVAEKERLAVLSYPAAHIDDLCRACLRGPVTIPQVTLAGTR